MRDRRPRRTDMTQHSSNVAGAVAEIARAVMVLLVPLALWRLAFPLTEWAALALLPLAVAIWMGIYRPLRDRRRAELAVVILPGARLGRWLTGRMGARLNATLATLVSLPVLAWQALAAPAPVLGLLGAVCLLAGLLSMGVTGVLGRGLSPPYARLAGHRIACATAALMALAPLVWINWAVIPVHHDITSLGLSEAMAATLDALPGRESWPREVMGAFAALDAGKLWLAAQYRDAVWVGLLFSLDAALVVFVTARAMVAVQDFTRHAVEQVPA
ncbi:hypothetical protein [Paracoccus sp. KR1-242]|uniref:hypothetical protein n=1 Tax=Paracoccus sp. KR1-242 TaxID=3410028 RepID=UPI003C0E52D0